MTQIKFEDIQNDEQLAEYLKTVLSRLRKPSALYHYTSFTSLKKIFDSNVLFLNRPSTMNDKAEAEIIRKRGLSNKLFYCCFSHAYESAELWNMYTELNNGCILEIPLDLAREMVQHYAVKEVKKRTITTTNIEDTNEKVMFCSVVYYSKEENKLSKLSCGTVENKGYPNFYETSRIAGMAKSDFWRFESEVRLILNSEKEWPEDVTFGLALREDFWSKCKIIISPFSTREKVQEIKEYCNSKGIECRESPNSGSINFNNRLFNNEKTKQWITDRFNKIWDINKVPRNLNFDELIAKIIVHKLNTCQSVSYLKSEELQDEICSLFNDLDRVKVQKFVNDVIKYLEV